MILIILMSVSLMDAFDLLHTKGHLDYLKKSREKMRIFL